MYEFTREGFVQPYETGLCRAVVGQPRSSSQRKGRGDGHLSRPHARVHSQKERRSVGGINKERKGRRRRRGGGGRTIDPDWRASMGGRNVRRRVKWETRLTLIDLLCVPSP